MKPFLKLLLVCTLALSLSCAAGEGDYAPITDPTLIPEIVPDGFLSAIADLGEGRIFGVDRSGRRIVYDLAAGTAAPLSLRGEDIPYWQQVAADLLRAEGIATAAGDLPDDPEALLQLIDPLVNPWIVTSSRYVLIDEHGILDRETALLLPSPPRLHVRA